MTPATTPPGRLRRTIELFRAMGRILWLRWPAYDFNDLATVQDCLDGPAFRRAADLMRSDPVGRHLLYEQPAFKVREVPWTWMSTLPVDSLGYNCWHHFHANNILQPVDLDDPIVRWDADTEAAKDRYRGTHDVRHVLCGLGVAGGDEVTLQAFQCAQLPQKLSVLVVVFGGLKHLLLDGWSGSGLGNVWRAWKTGRKARFLGLLGVRASFGRPLVEVRAELGLEPLGAAYPVRERHPDAPWQTPRQWAS